MIEIKKHTIYHSQKISEALRQLNELGIHLTLFVLDDNDRLIGTVTDGDIRRGFLQNFSIQDNVRSVMHQDFKYLFDGDLNQIEIFKLKELGIALLPQVDQFNRIKKILNLQLLQAILPVDAVIMAGGEGRRLRPLTEKVPKPLLKVGAKPIIEHNIDRLINFGVVHFCISIGYLGDQIEQFFEDGSFKGIQLRYIHEDVPLGTIGAVKKINSFNNNHVLIINSDLLTNINYLEFYSEFVKQDADFAVATIPYSVNVPYAVLETINGRVTSFKEKPTYTYHSNAGIYLAKKEIFEHIPDGFFNATDLMETLIKKGHKILSFPLVGYWLDIGKHDDYVKANEDIKHLMA